VDSNESNDVEIDKSTMEEIEISSPFSSQGNTPDGSRGVEIPVRQVPRAVPKPKKGKGLLIVAIIILLLAGAGAAWYFIFRDKTTVANTNNANNNQNQNAAVVETDPQLIKMATPTTGEVWLDAPIELAKQGFYKPGQYSTEDEAVYSKVGTRDGKDIIVSETPALNGTNIEFFEKSASGEISYIAHPVPSGVYNDDANGLSYTISTFITTIKIDKITSYDTFNIPDKIKLDDKGSVALAPNYPTVGYFYTAPDSTSTSTKKETVIKQIGKGSLVRSETTNVSTGLTSLSYFIRTSLNTVIGLRYEPLDLSLTGYQWNSGVNYADGSLKAMTYGCGGLGGSIVTEDAALTDSDAAVIGKSSEGLTIYGFTSQSNPLLVKAYDEYKQALDDGAIDTNGPTVKSISDFASNHAVVLFKSLDGRWLVYTRTSLAPMYGCAKPVVYLYPTTTQTVRVKVGADVKVSDPLYDASKGWTAIAQPNGQLSVNGATYGSLFWEGPGYGAYPEVTSGTIVKKADAISTIRTQLAQQGLNVTETNEFMAYWQDQIPNKPYVRLTWFNTAQMNNLAPLYISPKPDTLIRVFLDMDGLDAPINLPKQTLKSIPRNGFTVVEWGGLSKKKLY